MKLRTALDEAPPAVDVAEKATKIRVNLLRDVAKWLAGGEDKGATTLLRSALTRTKMPGWDAGQCDVCWRLKGRDRACFFLRYRLFFSNMSDRDRVRVRLGWSE